MRELEMGAGIARASRIATIAAALVLAACEVAEEPVAEEPEQREQLAEAAPEPEPVAEAADAAPLLDPARFRIVDLSHHYDEETLYWPTQPHGFEHEVLHEGEDPEAGYFYAAMRFCMPEHTGTHMDAPYHFHEAGQSAAEVPLERLIGPAVVIDVREEASADRDYRLDRARVAAFEAEHGEIPEDAIVLLRTGWSRHWPDAEAYFGDDLSGDPDEWTLSFPSFGEAAAEHLIEERGAAVLGVDTASIDYGRTETVPVHRLAARNDVPGLENLTGLDALPATGAWVIALPMKIAGGSGGPVRVAALVPHEAGG